MDINVSQKLDDIAHHYPAKSRWIAFATVLLSLGVWQALAVFGGLPAFILPSPIMVIQRFFSAMAAGTLANNALVTLGEVLLGLCFGAGSATVVGYAIAKSKTFETIISPFLVASQAIPIVAIAPLFIIWFGQGIFSKVLICALIVFFPVLVNTVVGLRAVPQSLNELMKSLHATRWQKLVFLEIPAALPIFLGGLRIGATLSVIGAVVGEFVGSDQGLGFLINVGRGQYDTALVFVAVFTLVAMALCLYGIIIYLEHRLLKWQ